MPGRAEGRIAFRERSREFGAGGGSVIQQCIDGGLGHIRRVSNVGVEQNDHIAALAYRVLVAQLLIAAVAFILGVNVRSFTESSITSTSES